MGCCQLSTEDIAILDEITKRTAGKPFDVDALGYEDVGMNEGGRKGFRVEDVEGVRARVKDSGIYYQDFDGWKHQETGNVFIIR